MGTLRTLPASSNRHCASSVWSNEGDVSKCPLYSRRRTCAVHSHVRFTPESRHVQRTGSCLLRANRGHGEAASHYPCAASPAAVLSSELSSPLPDDSRIWQVSPV